MYPEQNLSRIPNPVSKVAESKISKSYSPKHKYTPSLIELVVGTVPTALNRHPLISTSALNRHPGPGTDGSHSYPTALNRLCVIVTPKSLYNAYIDTPLNRHLACGPKWRLPLKSYSLKPTPAIKLVRYPLKSETFRYFFMCSNVIMCSNVNNVLK